MPAGRPKGAPNKKSRINLLAAKYDLKPLDYMLEILNDPDQDQSARMDAAKSAAPYIHARLQSVTVQEKPYEGDPNAITSEYLAGIVQGAGSSDAPATSKGKRVSH